MSARPRPGSCNTRARAAGGRRGAQRGRKAGAARKVAGGGRGPWQHTPLPWALRTLGQAHLWGLVQELWPGSRQFAAGRCRRGGCAGAPRPRQPIKRPPPSLAPRPASPAGTPARPARPARRPCRAPRPRHAPQRLPAPAAHPPRPLPARTALPPRPAARQAVQAPGTRRRAPLGAGQQAGVAPLPDRPLRHPREAPAHPRCATPQWPASRRRRGAGARRSACAPPPQASPGPAGGTRRPRSRRRGGGATPPLAGATPALPPPSRCPAALHRRRPLAPAPPAVQDRALQAPREA